VIARTRIGKEQSVSDQNRAMVTRERNRAQLGEVEVGRNQPSLRPFYFAAGVLIQLLQNETVVRATAAYQTTDWQRRQSFGEKRE
jgi:hypothetical protein